MDIYFIIICLVVLITFGLVGSYVSQQKGRDAIEGFLFGFLGSIVGLIILALLPNKTKTKSTNSTNPPSQKSIQKAKDNDFFSQIIGILLLIAVIYFFYWGFNR